MKPTVKRILGILLSFAMMLSLISVCFAADETQITGANWMSTIGDYTPITAINMPGTHDSAASNTPFSAFAQTQSLSIAKQLESGVRYLDVRLKKSGDDYISVHTINNKQSVGLFAKDLLADDIIADCKEFLNNNPYETILMIVKEESSNAGTSFFAGFYDKYVKDNPDDWFVENRIPDLGEVRGKIVLLRYNRVDPLVFDDSNSGINLTTYPYVPGNETIDFKTSVVTSVDETRNITMLYVQDSFNLAPDKKWQAITTFLESEKYTCDFNICVTSSMNGLMPIYNSRIINGRLLNYPFAAGETYGIISMDFVTAELCEKVFMTNENIMTQPAANSVTSSEETTYAFLGKYIQFFRDLFAKFISSIADKKV